MKAQLDLRQPTNTVHPFCAANCNNAGERKCIFYQRSISTCAGEIEHCVNRGKSYPIGGYTYCTLSQTDNQKK